MKLERTTERFICDDSAHLRSFTENTSNQSRLRTDLIFVVSNKPVASSSSYHHHPRFSLRYRWAYLTLKRVLDRSFNLCLIRSLRLHQPLVARISFPKRVHLLFLPNLTTNTRTRSAR